MGELRKRRWRASLVVEFETRDYPAGEKRTAERHAALMLLGVQRADGDINARTTAERVLRVIPVDDA